MEGIEVQRIRERLERLRAREHELELQKASFGLHCPAPIEIDLKDAKREIAALQQELLTFGQQAEVLGSNLKAQASAKTVIAAAPLTQQAYRVGVYSYSAKNASNHLDYSLDLEGYFSQSTASGLPPVHTWEMDLLPRLRRVLAQSNEQPLDTIALDAQVHNSVGIALGSLFPETSRYTLRIRQQEQWWSSRAPASNSQLVHVNDQGAPSTQAAIDYVVLANVLTQHFILDDLREICFSQRINFEDIEGATLSSKARGLVTYMRQRNRLVELQNAVIEARPLLADELQQTLAAKQLIALEVGIARPISAVHNDVKRSLQRLGLPINRHIQLGLIGERVEGEQEAQQIAKTIVKTIKRLRDQEGYRQELHLFTALPTALAVMLGCQLNACGPIQLYEYSKNGDHSYYPAWRYNS
jgi:hypothetical protein